MSPARPSSNCFLNISTPVTTVFCVSRKPTISTSSPTFTLPRSIRPVTTVPRPWIEKISSIGIRKGLSTSLAGSGTFLSTASISSSIDFSHLASPFKAPKAEPRTMGSVSPGNWYLVSSSLTSISTRSTSSASSTASTLFRNTTIYGTPTCRASSTCSRVCGIGPSVAATTRMAPSICAAPVIMFLM